MTKWKFTAGKQGVTTIKYNVNNGIYSDFEDPDVSDLESEFEDLQ